MSNHKVTRKGKYTVRIPPARIKKIIQTDEEIGKMANAVPVMIGRSLEMFCTDLLTQATDIAHSRQAKTLTPQILKEAVKSRELFQFLTPLMTSVVDNDGPNGSAATKRRGSRSVNSEEVKTKKSRGRRAQVVVHNSEDDPDDFEEYEEEEEEDDN